MLKRKFKNIKVFWILIILLSMNSLTFTINSPAAQQFSLKWTYNTNAHTAIGPLAVVVNDDGIYEVFKTGRNDGELGKVTCLNGATGELIWSYSNGRITNHAPFEIKDLNNDGIEEIVIAAGLSTIALHANDGSVYWNVDAQSGNKHLVIGDIENNGYPYVYVCSCLYVCMYV